jgi:DUF1680 family protein
MAFIWREYLDLARVLPSQCPQTCSVEAAERCGVSRAYYAAFCHARNYAQAHLGFTPAHTGADHALVRQHYHNNGKKDIANRLATLHQYRKLCDYNDMVQNTSRLFGVSIRAAEYIINKL